MYDVTVILTETFSINGDPADLILLIKKKKAIKNHFHFYFILLIEGFRGNIS